MFKLLQIDYCKILTISFTADRSFADAKLLFRINVFANT